MKLIIQKLQQTKKIFLKNKGLLFDETPGKIQWDTQTQDGLLKCKVDKEHIILVCGSLYLISDALSENLKNL